MDSDDEDLKSRKGGGGKKLTRKLIGDGLSLLAKTGDGLGHAYIRLVVKVRCRPCR